MATQQVITSVRNCLYPTGECVMLAFKKKEQKHSPKTERLKGYEKGKYEITICAQRQRLSPSCPAGYF